MISIAVLGYGTVGSGVVEVLEKNKDVINQRAGDEISVKYVLDDCLSCHKASTLSTPAPFLHRPD